MGYVATACKQLNAGNFDGALLSYHTALFLAARSPCGTFTTLAGEPRGVKIRVSFH